MSTLFEFLEKQNMMCVKLRTRLNTEEMGCQAKLVSS